MTDFKDLTPIVVGLLSASVAWLFKTVIQQGKDLTAVQTALKIYFEGTAKGAAKVLDSPNPTPEHMRVLLRKFYQNHATEPEKDELRNWLKQLCNDPKAPKSERSAAIDILAAFDAMKVLNRRGKASGHH